LSTLLLNQKSKRVFRFYVIQELACSRYREKTDF
jgi:hypothetical protein